MMHTVSTLSILWCHGVMDDVIPISFAKDALAFLQDSAGIPTSKLEFHAYDGLGHTIEDNEVDDVTTWLRSASVFG
jgi:predicted esterase